MSLREVLLLEVREATTGAVVATGCLRKTPEAIPDALARAQKWFKKNAPASGMAAIVRCPARQP